MPPLPVELRLVPAPGAKPEFLAAIQPLPGDDDDGSVVPPVWRKIQAGTGGNAERGMAAAAEPAVIVLEGYTRDAWASDTSTRWTSLLVTSVDGRNKLPGFVTYLRERQKMAYGRFAVAADDNDGDDGEDSGTGQVRRSQHYVWVVSHKQATSSALACRVAPLSSIPNCPLKPTPSDGSGGTTPATAVTAASTQGTVHQRKGRPLPLPSSSAPGQPTTKKTKKGAGLLGNLVAGQRRTNQQVVAAAAAAAVASGSRGKAATTATTQAGGAVPLDAAGTAPGASAAAQPANGNDSGVDNGGDVSKTSGQVLADFRHEMEQKMLDFDIAPDQVLTIHVKLSDHVRGVVEADRGNVSVEVLKYIVYEQAEEVNEEWIAYKEPTEFLDEFTVSVYKDAEAAPPDVLEDLNRAEITDEMRAQQTAMQEQRRQQEVKAARHQAQLQMEALRSGRQGGAPGAGPGGLGGEEDDGDFAVLNARKRDRRTIEDYQREIKRPKGG